MTENQASQREARKLAQAKQIYVKYCLEGNAAACAGLVDSLLKQSFGIPDIYLGVFSPALAAIGDLWQKKKASVPQEHMATQITLEQMGRLRQLMPAKRSLGLSCVVTAVEGDPHILGGRIAADFLIWDGWNVDFLGADTPAAELCRYCRERKYDLVCLSITLAACVPALKRTCRELSRLPAKPKVMIGGASLLAVPSPLAIKGADAMACDAVSASVEARKLFGLVRPKIGLQEYLKRLAECIQLARKNLALSQKDLAARAGLDRAYISSVESGKQNVSIAAISRLAGSLELSIEDLLSADPVRIGEITGSASALAG